MATRHSKGNSQDQQYKVLPAAYFERALRELRGSTPKKPGLLERQLLQAFGAISEDERILLFCLIECVAVNRVLARQRKGARHA